MRTRIRRARTLASVAAVLCTALLAPLSPARAQAPPRPAVAGDDTESFATADRTRSRPTAAELDQLLVTATARGQVDVSVGLPIVFTPEGALTADGRTGQRSAISTAAKALTDSLPRTGFTVLRSYDSIPHIALRLTPEGVRALAVSDRAASVRESIVAAPLLAQTGALVESGEAHVLSRTGTGQYVAIVDTGIARDHEFFGSPSGSRVVDEACFATACPNPSVGPGAAAPCAMAVCDHGTHVAGIAAGAQYCANAVNCPIPLGGSPIGSGMATDAKIIAVQVFSDTCAPYGCAGANLQDIDAALVHILNLAATRTIAAVNLSLGVGIRYPDCDGAFPSTTDAVDNLRSVKVATVIASGNDGSTQGVAWPACISGAVTVGSTTKADVVWPGSNLTSQVELLAPGGDQTTGGGVTSSVSPSGYGSKFGTSMAAAHVSGAWAVVRAAGAMPSGAWPSVGTVLQSLQVTGKPITANGTSYPRIRILAASTRFKDTGFQTSVSSAPLLGGGMVSAGTGLTGGSGTMTLALPSGTVPVVAYLYWTTLGGDDHTGTLQTPTGTVGVGGALRGASADTCQNANQFEPLRTYRATIATSSVTSGSYTVSGIGGAGIVTHGASLVVVYKAQSPTSTTPKTKVYLRDGALTVAGYGGKSDLFPVPVPAGVTVQAAQVHIGVANGTAGGWDRSRLANQFLGTGDIAGGSGSRWDDKTYAVSPGELPLPGQIYSLDRGVYLETGSQNPECMGWAYQGLTYQYT